MRSLVTTKSKLALFNLTHLVER